MKQNSNRDQMSQSKMKEVFSNKPQENYLLSVTTPLFTDYGDTGVNISTSVSSFLSKEGFLSKTYEEKDENGNSYWMYYYSNNDFEVYNLIKPDHDLSELKATFVFYGSSALMNHYHDEILSVINDI